MAERAVRSQGGDRINTLITTIISCEARGEARALTIPQLRAAGLFPIVELSPCTPENPAGGRENAIVSARAIGHALDAGTDLLFCEDDIDLAPDFPRFLHMARSTERVTYFYLHDPAHYMSARYGLELTHAILKRQPITAGLYELKERRNLTGGQCVFMPHEFLQRAHVATLANGERPIDIWLSAVLQREERAPLVALPHPVQHRQVRVARVSPNARNPDKFSRSFTLERRWLT